MFCGASYDARLDLRIEWYKGGVRLMKFLGHIALEGRSSGPPRLLFIDDVTVDDRGNYSCHAYTKIGEVISEQWAHGRLRIKGKTYFVTFVSFLRHSRCVSFIVIFLYSNQIHKYIVYPLLLLFAPVDFTKPLRVAFKNEIFFERRIEVRINASGVDVAERSRIETLDT